jgi:hypothetical protein
VSRFSRPAYHIPSIIYFFSKPKNLFKDILAAVDKASKGTRKRKKVNLHTHPKGRVVKLWPITNRGTETPN